MLFNFTFQATYLLIIYSQNISAVLFKIDTKVVKMN